MFRLKRGLALALLSVPFFCQQASAQTLEVKVHHTSQTNSQTKNSAIKEKLETAAEKIQYIIETRGRPFDKYFNETRVGQNTMYIRFDISEEKAEISIIKKDGTRGLFRSKEYQMSLIDYAESPNKYGSVDEIDFRYEDNSERFEQVSRRNKLRDGINVASLDPNQPRTKAIKDCISHLYNTLLNQLINRQESISKKDWVEIENFWQKHFIEGEVLFSDTPLNQ